MSAPVSTAVEWQWPADVVEFAARNKVQVYLDPLLEAIRRLFPTANVLKVYLGDDPEIHDLWNIVFEVQVSPADVPDYVKAKWAWHQEQFRICPAPLAPLFCLMLLRMES